MPPKTRSIAALPVTKKRAASNNLDLKKVVKHAKRHEKEAPISRFMALPGELRNAIYSFCQVPHDEVLIHNPRSRRSKTQRENQRDSFRSFYSLAHVSQQVRREYLPLYISRIAHCMRFEDISAYVRAFGHATPRIAGEITLELTQCSTTAARKYDLVDVAPLIRLCRAHPGIRIVPLCFWGSCDSDCVTYNAELKSWLTYCIPTLTTGPVTSAQAKWAAYFDTAVVAMYVRPMRVRLWPVYQSLWVQVVVKPTYVEWWMGFEKAWPRAYLDNIDLIAWVKKTGHYGMENLAGLSVRGAK